MSWARQDAWNWVLFDGIRAVGWGGAGWFILWILVGSFVLLNLLLVIILDSYVTVADEMHEEEAREQRILDAKLKAALPSELSTDDGFQLSETFSNASASDVFSNPLAASYSDVEMIGAVDTVLATGAILDAAGDTVLTWVE